MGYHRDRGDPRITPVWVLFRILKSGKTGNPEKYHVTYQIKALFKLVDMDYKKNPDFRIPDLENPENGKKWEKIIFHLDYFAESHAADRPLLGEFILNCLLVTKTFLGYELQARNCSPL